MYLRKILIGVMVLLSSMTTAFAQTEINGRVLDQQTQKPIRDANILVSGSKNGTTTNQDGLFHLETKENAKVLVISHVGYVKKTITIKNDTEYLNILLEPDNIALNDVQVVGFDTKKTLLESSASLAVITSKDFERTNRVSIQSVLNTIPGVRMDQSNLTDARISIRGGGIRSNFGIRNIKIYLNDIPLTEADGFTRIEGLDASTIGRAEVIKGPASSIYGVGTGGVINFKMEKAPYGQNSLESNTVIGSYGLRRISTTFRSGSDKFNASITTGRQLYEGYRNHNEDDRKFFTGSLQFFPSNEQTVTIILNRSGQETFIPGNLNENQVASNPRQANKNNVAQDAGRFQTWTRTGVSHSYEFSEQLSNTTSFYTSFYDLDHPLPFAYIRQPYQSYGGRTKFTIDPSFQLFPTKIILGGEFLNGRTDAKRFVNNGGQEGPLILNQELDNTQYSIFYQSETDLTQKTKLSVGISYNKVSYKIKDFIETDLSGTKKFDAEFAPRIGLSHIFDKKFALRASISYGFSPPTTNEIKDRNGHIKSQIQAEKGVNYEIGARGDFMVSNLSYDIALFSLQMQDQLIPQTVGQNNIIYNNAGRTDRTGLELALSHHWSNDLFFINSTRTFFSYTLSSFSFKDYKILDSNGDVISDFSGNDLTGISPNVISAGIDLNSRTGLYLGGTWFYNDKSPLADDNQSYLDSYSIMNLKLGYEKPFKNILKINIQSGINNLFDQLYTSHTALNARSFGNEPPAYFNPAPGRNLYAGISITYIF